MTTEDDVREPIDELAQPFEWSTAYRRGENGLELVVEGTAVAPTSGWSAELIAERPGINPKMLRLRLTVQRPTGPVIEVLTPITACHVGPVESEDQYDEVQIIGITTLRV